MTESPDSLVVDFRSGIFPTICREESGVAVNMPHVMNAWPKCISAESKQII
jgi:hypothetical protein